MKRVLHQHKKLILATLFCFGQTLAGTQTSFAQGTMSDKAMEKSHFYNAPREYQIVDDRPVIRDFREGPNAGGQIGIPNGPGGGQGAGGMGGIGGGSGVNPTIPAGGLPLTGGTGPGYRNAPVGMSSLPKSGFGGSNIPAGGMGPRGILPGVNMGVTGKVMSQNKQAAAVPMRATSVKGPSGGSSVKTVAPPTVTSYGGYSNHPTSYGNSSRTEQSLRGRLLRGK